MAMETAPRRSSISQRFLCCRRLRPHFFGELPRPVSRPPSSAIRISSRRLVSVGRRTKGAAGLGIVGVRICPATTGSPLATGPTRPDQTGRSAALPGSPRSGYGLGSGRDRLILFPPACGRVLKDGPFVFLQATFFLHQRFFNQQWASAVPSRISPAVLPIWRLSDGSRETSVSALIQPL